MDARFERILALSGIDRYSRGLWFGDCAFDGKNILAPDALTKNSIERLFVDQIHEATGVKVNVMLMPPKPAKPSPRDLWNDRSKPKERQGDFL